MAKPKGGLGRGLDSLFADSAAGGGSGPENGEVSTLPLAEIEPDPNQPRKTFDPEAISKLAQSITENGLLQPIAVRACPTGGYRIIAGERRWRACREAGLRDVPVIVKEVTDQQAMELALVENLQREDLDPVEEAMGYRQLMEKCSMTQEQAAARLGKSRSALANSLRLLNLPPHVLELLKTGQLSTGHAKAILSLPEYPQMDEAADWIVKCDLNVRQAEHLCKKMQQPKEEKEPPFKLENTLPAEVEASLKDVTGNEVKVTYKKGKGNLTLHFYSDEQLMAFANLLGQYKKEE